MRSARRAGLALLADHYGDNFYGGDLAGITEKINAGYFDNLGVTVLYLNPIFRSPSNHKYDTADYLTIDPDFGTLADFQILVATADAHGMKIILDGVFNHVVVGQQILRPLQPLRRGRQPDQPPADRHGRRQRRLRGRPRRASATGSTSRISASPAATATPTAAR